LVRRLVCGEPAGFVPVAAVRLCAVLSQRGGAAGNIDHRYMEIIGAIYRPTANWCRPGHDVSGNHSHPAAVVIQRLTSIAAKSNEYRQALLNKERLLFYERRVMKKKKPAKNNNLIYEPPVLYPGLFYFLLATWTVVCIVLLGSRALKTGWPIGQLLMIAFVLAYTWYFSLGISYKITLYPDGTIELTSFRRKITVKAGDISMAEGPRFAIIPFGFIRFRLEREKAYLFIRITDEPLQKILAVIRRKNPEIKFKGL